MATTSAKTKPSKRPATCSVPPGEPVPVIKGSHVYLVDGSGYIFRAFHALPPLTRPSDGLPVGAVHGFCAMLWKLLQDAKKGHGPTHLAVIFDASEKTFRNEIYKDYKAHRPPAPEELLPQFPLIRDAVKAFNIACLEQDGFEADDLIATYAKQVVAAGGDVTIVSSDKDLMQLIRPGILMLDTMKNRTIGPDEVRERFGVPPEKVVDVQALAGDSTDNVPGVPGIGIKTAAELINEFGDLESLLARAGEIKQPKRRERLTEFAIQARLSLDLVTLKSDVPLTVAAEALGVRDPVPDTLLGFLREMEFATLTKRIADGLGTDAPPPVERSVGSAPAHPAESPPAAGKASARLAPVSSNAAPAAAVAAASTAAKAKIDRSAYETVVELPQLQAWLAEARAAGRFAFDIETTSLDPMQAEFVGFSLAVAPGRACYVPLNHRAGSGFDFSDGFLQQVPVR
ncbi:MAG TPA: 5'-3' exonuclease H3TH domain-containing protein, partial [Hyphomicrobiaceae bacterium]|nr:5'-3' exonuclease H3TH domain-containing protein [Hyphomicrobiaceae bacterium]